MDPRLRRQSCRPGGPKPANSRRQSFHTYQSVPPASRHPPIEMEERTPFDSSSFQVSKILPESSFSSKSRRTIARMTRLRRLIPHLDHGGVSLIVISGTGGAFVEELREEVVPMQCNAALLAFRITMRADKTHAWTRYPTETRHSSCVSNNNPILLERARVRAACPFPPLIGIPAIVHDCSCSSDASSPLSLSPWDRNPLNPNDLSAVQISAALMRLERNGQLKLTRRGFSRRIDKSHRLAR